MGQSDQAFRLERLTAALLSRLAHLDRLLGSPRRQKDDASPSFALHREQRNVLESERTLVSEWVANAGHPGPEFQLDRLTACLLSRKAALGRSLSLSDGRRGPYLYQGNERLAMQEELQHVEGLLKVVGM